MATRAKKTAPAAPDPEIEAEIERGFMKVDEDRNASAETVETVQATDIVVFLKGVGEQAPTVFAEGADWNSVLEPIKIGLIGLPTDMSEAANRERVRTVAAHIAKTAVSIDKERKNQTSELRARTNAINAIGNAAEESLRELQTKVRAPLTAWEVQDAKRQDACRAAIAQMERDGLATFEDTAADVAERLAAFEAMAIDATMFAGFVQQAEAAREAGIRVLSAALATLKRDEAIKRQAEADALELAAMRQREADRLAEDQRKVEAAAKAERDRIAAEEKAERDRIAAIEAKRIEDERVETERVARERAAEDARIAAEEKARLAQEERDRQHEASIVAAEKERAARAARAQAEIDAANKRAAEAHEKARADLAAQQEAERLAAEKRERSIKHAKKIMGEAKLALMDTMRTFIENGNIEGALETAAIAIVTAIRKNEIPHVTIKF